MSTLTPEILADAGYVVDFDENIYAKDVPVADPLTTWTRRFEDKFSVSVVSQAFSDGRPPKVIVSAGFRKDGRAVTIIHHDAANVSLRSLEQSFEDAWAVFRFDFLPKEEQGAAA
jgi:hypothetical protein